MKKNDERRLLKENIQRKILEKPNLIKAIFSLVGVSIIVAAVSSYLIFREGLIGPIFILMGILNLLFIKLWKINLHFITSDFVFGFIDNGVMVFAAIIGGSFGGIAGAVIGGVAGNTITDGLGGFFEGYVSENIMKRSYLSKRSALSSSLGKMTGCLFGAGISLTFVFLFKMFF